jgi:hypothetical protein
MGEAGGPAEIKEFIDFCWRPAGDDDEHDVYAIAL